MGEKHEPLVATRARWAASSAALLVALIAVAAAGIAFAGLHRTVWSLAQPIALGAGIGSVLLLAILRAEESRLARQLRVARVGTAVLRESTIRRHERAPLLARLLSSQLGLAAVLLADGDREGALDVLAGASALTRGGRIDALRAIVDADLERATGTPVALALNLQALRDMAPLDNREADLYRTRVLAKSILEHGDADAAFELAGKLGRSRDDDERIYGTWVRVWFDLDHDEGPAGPAGGGGEPWPPLVESDVRLAILAARVHGAEKLLTKLEERLLAIALPDRQE